LPEHVRPAGAAPLSRLGERVGGRGREDAVLVEVDGEPWAAAIEPADSLTCRVALAVAPVTLSDDRTLLLRVKER
jgi:hypothetical protein